MAEMVLSVCELRPKYVFPLKKKSSCDSRISLLYVNHLTQVNGGALDLRHWTLNKHQPGASLTAVIFRDLLIMNQHAWGF